MSNFPSWWDTTITVYSKHVVASVVTWHKVVITDCFWKRIGNKVNVGDVIIDTENIVCRIPKNEKYLDPLTWMESAESALDGFFTLQPGDIIVKGICADDINEYQSGKRSTDLINKYRQVLGCLEIKDVSINTMTGMINPHYSVKGI